MPCYGLDRDHLPPWAPQWGFWKVTVSEVLQLCSCWEVRPGRSGHWRCDLEGVQCFYVWLCPPFSLGFQTMMRTASFARPFHHALPTLASANYRLNLLKPVSQNKLPFFSVNNGYLSQRKGLRHVSSEMLSLQEASLDFPSCQLKVNLCFESL